MLLPHASGTGGTGQRRWNLAYVDGVPVNLGGNQLPNAPDWTVSLGAQYTFQIMNDWTAVPRVDFYWQDTSCARIFNAVNDYLKSYEWSTPP